jgi:glyoxylase-like metal-dependent hydrolase (beta-lactamase superfamily II)
MDPDEPAVEQMRRAGDDPARVAAVLVSHLHNDHVGGLEDFPAAALWVSRDMWEAGEGGTIDFPARAWGHLAESAIRPLDLRAAPPYATFAHGLDLFGDGTLVALATPGHTPGHTSLLVNLRGGSFLLTGDTAWVDANWRGPTPKGLVGRIEQHDNDADHESAWRIKRFAELAGDALTVVPGHDQGVWSRLRHYPARYE